MLYLFACVYGLAHGCFFTAIFPLVAEIFGIRAHGAIFGIGLLLTLPLKPIARQPR